MHTRERQQAAITQLGRFALAGLDIAATIQEGIEAVARILEFKNVGYFEWHPQTETLVLRQAVGFERADLGHASVRAAGDDLLGAALESPLPLAVEDFEQPNTFRPSPLLRRYSTRSALAGAAEGRNHAYGVICAISPEARVFSSEDLQFLQDILQTLAQAIERERYESDLAELNRTLEQRVEERSRLVKLLQEVAVLANRSTSLEDALENVLGLLCRNLHWQIGQVYRAVTESEEIRFEHFSAYTTTGPFEDLIDLSREATFDLDEGWVGRVAAGGKAQWIMEIAEVEAIDDDPRLQAALDQGLKPVLASPVLIDEETIAIFEFYDSRWRVPEDPLLDAMAQIGSQLAVVARRERIEEDLRLAKENAESAARTKAEFLANMSHEIRTPVNAVIGMTELLLGTRLTAQQKDFFDTIRSSSSALLAVIEDILDFSKIESGALELEHAPFELRRCLEEALDIMTSRVAEKDIHLAYWMEENVPEVIVGDITRLRQILVNLLSNAVKFTTKGEVRLHIEGRQELHREGHGSGQSSPWELAFAIHDTGIGIPADRTARLFLPFTQIDASTTRRFGGTGLGLVISRELCERMGGGIEVESTPGEGSIFRFSIQAPSIETPVPIYLQPSPVMMRGKRVLLYTDYLTHQKLFGRYLKLWGMRTVIESRAEDVRKRLDRDEVFDLAILDTATRSVEQVALQVRMASGTRGSRQPADPLPLVMLTSVRGMRTIHSAGDRAMRYLTEPIRPERLHDILLDAIVGREPERPEDESLEPPTQADRPASQISDAFPMGILLVEDNLVNQKVALKMLEMLGYEAALANNGQEALEALEDVPYDLVLMDLQMPILDGLEASRAIRARWPEHRQPKIIAMTANAMKEDRDRCLAAGMDHYISKPVTLETLRKALKRFSVARPD